MQSTAFTLKHLSGKDRLMSKLWIDLPALGDERGNLSVAEVGGHVPFEIKRVYWIYGTSPDVTRGLHAHRELQQLAIAVSGSCKMLLDDGTSRASYSLDNPTRGLFIESGMWHEMTEFTENCVLLVIASQVYDEADYIRDYEEFLRFRK